MNYRNDLEGVSITGVNICGDEINGTIVEVGKGFNVAVIKIGNDRLDRDIAYLKDIEEVQDKV